MIDLSELSKRKVAVFMADFLETLYRMKAKDAYRTTMMLIVDEADAIAPQQPQKGEERMLGAAEDIVRRGGQRGLGIALVSQRAAVLNKNVLTQCGVLFLLRTTGSQDIDAVDHWIKKHGQADKRAQVMDSIAALARGSAWVWAPGWPTERGLFKLVDISLCTTFDSGQTPKPGEKRVLPKTVADVDLDAFREAMAATIEKAKADDPKSLRARIAELERDLDFARRTRTITPAAPPEPITVHVLDDAVAESLTAAAHDIARAAAIAAAAADAIRAEVREVTLALNQRPHRSTRVDIERTPAPKALKRHGPATYDGGHGPLKKGAREMLRALASMFPRQLTRTQVATLAGLSPRSGTYANYLGALRGAGLVVDNNDALMLTGAGLEQAGDPPAPMSTEELVALWSSKLKAGARRMLDALVLAYPKPITRDELAQRAGIEARSGTFANYLGALRGNDLAEDVTGGIRAGDALFLGGR